MVKRPDKAPSPPAPPASRWPLYLSLLALIGALLYFGLPPFIELDEDGNYVLSEARQQDYREKPARSERIEVYRLLAAQTGLYPCLKCPGIRTIKLNAGEVWKYGISRNGKNRYPASFYASNKLRYQTLKITDILEAEQLERKLIIAYPLLPEAQQKMAQHGIFLKRPPGNTTRLDAAGASRGQNGSFPHTLCLFRGA